MPEGNRIGSSNPASRDASITPHDTNTFEATRALYIGTGGDLVCHLRGSPAGTTSSYKNVPDGTLLPLEVDLVHTDTTCTDIVGLY